MSGWIGREQRENEQVRNFVALTGASEEEARHHLEESGWNSTVALARYQNIDLSNRPVSTRISLLSLDDLSLNIALRSSVDRR